MLYRHLGMTSLAFLACAWMVATFAGRGEAEGRSSRRRRGHCRGSLPARLLQVCLVAVQVLLGVGYDLGYLVSHQIVPSLLQTTLLALILLPLLRRRPPDLTRPDVSAAPAL